MVWPFSSPDPTSSAIKSLDPALRDFLEKEAPKPAPAPSPPPRQIAPPPRPVHIPTSPEQKQIVPPESLYQDGRFADIWKTYRHPSEFEAAKTDQERLQDLVDAFNDRKAELCRAALENCAFELIDQQECYRSGTWGDRFTMCRRQTQTLGRCYTMQAKFLRALGYASMVERGAEEDERIQMHADKLYRQMLEQERLIEEAKKEGRPAPELKPVMSKENVAKIVGVQKPVVEGTEDPLGNLSEEKRVMFARTLEGKGPEERALLEREFEASMRTAKTLSGDAAKILEEEQRSRRRRKEEGKETVGDAIKRWWGWG